MSLKTTLQDERSLKDKILDNLVLLLPFFGNSQIDISRKLGYTQDVFSRVKSDPNYKGSDQLEAAMRVLLQLEYLKKVVEGKDDSERFMLLYEKSSSSHEDEIAVRMAKAAALETYSKPRRKPRGGGQKP